MLWQVTTVNWVIDWVVMIGIVEKAIVIIIVGRFDVFIFIEIDFGFIGNVGAIAVVWLELFH